MLIPTSKGSACTNTCIMKTTCITKMNIEKDDLMFDWNRSVCVTEFVQMSVNVRRLDGDCGDEVHSRDCRCSLDQKQTSHKRRRCCSGCVEGKSVPRGRGLTWYTRATRHCRAVNEKGRATIEYIYTHIYLWFCRGLLVLRFCEWC